MLLKWISLAGCTGALLLTFSGRVWALPLAVALWAAYERNAKMRAANLTAGDPQNSK